ncbi:MAG: glycoside hydrolase family 25 protein [Chitinophagaceae bacterium]|nr:glycoside hydrolase family 25 protein [Chitinophagaceae bacterium]
MARSKRKISKTLPWIIIILVFSTGGFLVGRNWWLEKQAGLIRYREFGIPIPSNYSLHGIDVSRYQQIINWDAVKAMNVQETKIHFAFIKATEGNDNTDFYFKRNWRKAKDAEMIRGAYHFFIASKDGTMQARNFINKVKLQSGDLPPVLDVEQTNGVSKAILQQRVKAFLYAAELAYGVKPVIYTNADFYKAYLSEEFDDYPLWVAHYLRPSEPRISRDWHFWQHSERGRVNGISGKVDFNVFNGDSTDFAKLLMK